MMAPLEIVVTQVIQSKQDVLLSIPLHLEDCVVSPHSSTLASIKESEKLHTVTAWILPRPGHGD